MQRAPLPRLLCFGAFLWVVNGVLLGMTPFGRGHASAIDARPAPRSRAAGDGATGRVRFTAVDESGAPVFARVVVRGASGKASEALALSERGAELVLDPGEYEAHVSRGPEWSIAIARIEVRAHDALERTLVLRREVSPSGYVGCDFHLHAEHSSDSEVRADDRIASIAAEGLDFAVPTEHNHISSYDAKHARGAPLFGTLPGVELTTWAPSVGHFNVFPAGALPVHRGRMPDELFAELRRDPRHVIQVNHPRLDDHIAYFRLGGLSERGELTTPFYSFDFDVLEVWNGYDLARPEYRDRVFREWLSVLEAGHRVAASGNSDSHDLLRQRPGYPRTYVWVGDRDAKREPEAVAAALKVGQAFVTSGPLLEVAVDGERPGGTVRASGDRVTVRARVQAASWMHVDTLQIWGGTSLIATRALAAPQRAEGEPLDLRLELELPIVDVPFLVVTVSGSRPMDAIGARRGALPYGFTNPIWITRSASRANKQYSATPAKES